MVQQPQGAPRFLFEFSELLLDSADLFFREMITSHSLVVLGGSAAKPRQYFSGPAGSTSRAAVVPPTLGSQFGGWMLLKEFRETCSPC